VWLDWADDTRAIAGAGGEYLDLRSQPGFRAWARVGAADSRVVLQIHHACCDGIAVLGVLGDLLVLYAAAVGRERAPKLPELPVERLRDRAVFDAGTTKRSLASGLRDVAMTVWVWWRIVFGRCRALAAGEGQIETGPAQEYKFLPFEVRVLGRDASQRLKDTAVAHGVTLNDLLLRDMLLVARDWNRAHGQARGGPLRINVPVFVRGRLGRDIPASNGIGFAFVTADPDRFRDPDALLRDVYRQTQRIKQWKLALYFLGGLAAAARFPRLVRWVLGRKKPLATVVLSYLGPALAQLALPRRDGKLVSGNVVVERMAGVPPVRPLTRASMVVLEYAGELTLAVRTDVHHFGPQDTRALVDAFAARLAETIDGA
jgi:hypothetical protein